MKALVIGADGFLGSSLVHHLEQMGWEVFKTSRRITKQDDHYLPLDIENGVADFKIPDQIEIAFLCASVTTTAQCERNKERSSIINVEETAHIVRRLVEYGAFVVFPSSSAVFDGTIPYPTVETPYSPTGTYGEQKVEAERKLLPYIPHVAIVRMSKIIGSNIPLLVKWEEQFFTHQPITCYEDFMLSPLSKSHIAKYLTDIATHRISGITQISASCDISYRDLAYRLADVLQIDRNRIVATQAAQRPEMRSTFRAHASLDCSILKKKLSILPPDPWEALEITFQEIAKKHNSLQT